MLFNIFQHDKCEQPFRRDFDVRLDPRLARGLRMVLPILKTSCLWLTPLQVLVGGSIGVFSVDESQRLQSAGQSRRFHSGLLRKDFDNSAQAAGELWHAIDRKAAKE
jgi:hypothetical protein